MKVQSVIIWKQNVFKTFLYVFFVIGLVLLGGYLFFGDKLLFRFYQGENVRFSARGVDEVLTIGYAFSPTSLDPVAFDKISRNYLVNVYEGLVRTDRDLNIDSSIAVSWGLLDPLTWEFRLRPGVKFHNGKTLSSDDVVYSIELAAKSEESGLKDLLNTIESVEAKDDNIVIIYTRVSDPLLLNKLAVTYIFPSGYSDFQHPVGTGAYRVDSYLDGVMTLSRNGDYWGQLPVFANVVLKSIPDRRGRIKAIEVGDIQLLADVPPSSACSKTVDSSYYDDCNPIKSDDINIVSIPSLEVSFIVFNFNNDFFSSKKVREALSYAFDKTVFEGIAFGFAKASDQFVSSGVFGFNPDIRAREFDMAKAKSLIDDARELSFKRVRVTFDYPERLSLIGEYVESQFMDLNIDVDLNPLSDLDLHKKIVSGNSDFYFLGWRSELGDASDVFQGLVHSRDTNGLYGFYNGSHMLNKKIDQLIEDSQKNLDEESRLDQLQQVMKIVVDEEFFGVPLFESETIYAVKDSIKFVPRVDSYVFASDIY